MIEWLGYLATVVIVISLLMSSIVKLRIINLIGGVLFAIYGYLIGSIPTALLNLIIVGIDIYYLYIIYREKDEYDLVLTKKGEPYLEKFLGDNNIQDELKGESYYYLVNGKVIGILSGEVVDGSYSVEIDYVEKAYRDYKIGRYYFLEGNIFKKVDVKRVTSRGGDKNHNKYLKEAGFSKEDGVYTLLR